MDPRPLGNTSLQVTRVGLGLAALGRPGYINLGHADDIVDRDVQAMEARCHAVLDAAWQQGVRYFDAARSYGRAEAFLSSWLAARGIEPGNVTVGSKWGYTYTADWQIKADKHEVKDHTLPVLQRQFGESRALLGAHLGLYQIHSATLDSGVLENQEVLAELARLRRSGLRIGLSLSGANQAEVLQRALDVRVDGGRLFDCVQATWNLLEPSAGSALQAAREAGLGVIVKEALANGRLTSRNPDIGLLQEEAGRLETTPDALALAAVLAQPWVDVVLSGAASAQQLRSNLAALAVDWTPELAERLASLREEPGRYWSQRSQLPWN